MKRLDYRALFDHLHPGFFDRPFIRNLEAGQVFREMAMLLADFSLDSVSIPVPGHITFGFCKGGGEALRRAVARVDADWPRYFKDDTPTYCAMAGDQIASFCIMTDWGVFDGLKIGGPGCVGTVPEFRRQGIGLRLVQQATALLKEQGYGLSWIHYTGVGSWYAKLGYQTVLRWDREGILPGGENQQIRALQK